MCVIPNGNLSRPKQRIPEPPNQDIEVTLKALSGYGFVWNSEDDVTNFYNNKTIEKAVRLSNLRYGANEGGYVILVTLTKGSQFTKDIAKYPYSYQTKKRLGVFWIASEPKQMDFQEVRNVLKSIDTKLSN